MGINSYAGHRFKASFTQGGKAFVEFTVQGKKKDVVWVIQEPRDLKMKKKVSGGVKGVVHRVPSIIKEHEDKELKLLEDLDGEDAEDEEEEEEEEMKDAEEEEEEEIEEEKEDAEDDILRIWRKKKRRKKRRERRAAYYGHQDGDDDEEL